MSQASVYSKFTNNVIDREPMLPDDVHALIYL